MGTGAASPGTNWLQSLPRVLSSGGETDDLGLTVIENKVRTCDRHATILHPLGSDGEKLYYRRAVGDFRLTAVHGEVVKVVVV